MGKLRALVDFIDSTLDLVGQSVGQSITDYCDLETADLADSRSALVSKGGDLLTVVEISGLRRLAGGEAFQSEVIEPLSNGLQSSMEKPGHAIQVFFESDPDSTAAVVNAALAPAENTARRLGLNMPDLIQDQHTVLEEWIVAERCYLVLWTRAAILNKQEMKRQQKINMEAALESTNRDKNAQRLYRVLTMLRNHHRAFVSAVVEELGQVGIVASLLDSHHALAAVRASLVPAKMGDDWLPSLPGDRVYPSVRKRGSAVETWEVAWPPLSWQLATHSARYKKENVVQIGNRIYAPVFVDLFPRNPQHFSSLFISAKNKSLPWRMSLLIESGGMGGAIKFRGILASIMTIGSSNNKQLAASYRVLREMEQRGVGSTVQVRMCLCTWAPAKQMDLLEERASSLSQTVENWGSCLVSESTGDPLAGVACTVPAFTQGSIATKSAAPLEDILTLCPFSRPSSPWEAGAVILRSPDGKIMPYQPHSSKQEAWISLIFAKSGSGKSVLLSKFNMGLCQSPGISDLPRIAVVDIGPSATGFIKLLQDALPPDKRHLAVSRRLRMVDSDAINPMDTQLGCRLPDPTLKPFLDSFVAMLATDVSQKTPYDGMSGLVAAVVQEVYVMKSDKFSPNPYVPDIQPHIDDILRLERMTIDDRTSWWEVVDFMMKKNHIHEAYVAQRYAVPIIPDLVKVAQSEKIRDEYGEIKVSATHELLVNAFCRLLTDALRFAPILASPTAFDVGDACIIALDLDEVAKGSGAIGDRIVAIMYMLARQVMVKDFYMIENMVDDMVSPPSLELPETVPVEDYKTYHKDKIRRVREVPKSICYDEFHRTAKAPQVREQVIRDMREGRKWKVDVTLVSQDLLDFDPQMIKFATGFFILNAGTKQTVDEIAQKFGLSSEYERYALEHMLRGPRAGGGTFLAKFDIKMVWYTALLCNPLGALELWAYSTTQEDAILRDRLYAEVGQIKARRWLALSFPSGSCAPEIEAKRGRMHKNQGGDEADVSIFDDIVKDVIRRGREEDAFQAKLKMT